MAFTYNSDVNSPNERDYVRFHINDIIEDEGPRPNDMNFSDEELDFILGIEGSWQRTVAACFEALAAAWFTNPTWQADGLAVSSSHTGKNFAEEAARWRKAHGGGGSSGLGYSASRTVIPVDGWSNDIAANEVFD